jgi:hypothetical protein
MGFLVCASRALSNIARLGLCGAVLQHVNRRLSPAPYDGLSRQRSVSSFLLVALVTDQENRDAFPMNEPRDSASPLGGEHYREMASGLRKLAHQCRFAGARRELLDLAARYDRRADYFDGRAR